METSSSAFEILLSQRGFILECDIDFECNHQTDEIFIWYIQECPCCMDRQWRREHNHSKYLSWHKRQGCMECMEGDLDGLGCGGHYNNFRMFTIKNNIETLSQDYTFIQDDPKPDEKIWEFDEDDLEPDKKL